MKIQNVFDLSSLRRAKFSPNNFPACQVSFNILHVYTVSCKHCVSFRYNFTCFNIELNGKLGSWIDLVYRVYQECEVSWSLLLTERKRKIWSSRFSDKQYIKLCKNRAFQSLISLSVYQKIYESLCFCLTWYDKNKICSWVQFFI